MLCLLLSVVRGLAGKPTTRAEIEPLELQIKEPDNSEESERKPSSQQPGDNAPAGQIKLQDVYPE